MRTYNLGRIHLGAHSGVSRRGTTPSPLARVADRILSHEPCGREGREEPEDTEGASRGRTKNRDRRKPHILPSEAPSARGILTDAMHHDSVGPGRTPTRGRVALVLHPLVSRRLRQPPVADRRVRLSAHHTALVFRCPQLVRRTLDVLAGRGPRDRAHDRPRPGKRTSHAQQALTVATR